jgi:FkbM family methyltransferase
MNRVTHLLKSALRQSVNLLGYDIVGHDGNNPRWRMAQFLAQNNIDAIFDVGANRGEFGWDLRDMGYRGRIVSFEPLQDAYALLTATAKPDPLWQVINIGLGDQDEQRVLNVAANSESSSFLPMLAAHEQAAPESRYIKREMATIRRLDGVFRDYAAPGEAVFLKIDTQGFERRVLEGAKSILKDVPLVQMECSLVPLYGDVDSIEAMIGAMRELGYAPIDQKPTFYHRDSHHLMQMDVVFLRQ